MSSGSWGVRLDEDRNQKVPSGRVVLVSCPTGVWDSDNRVWGVSQTDGFEWTNPFSVVTWTMVKDTLFTYFKRRYLTSGSKARTLSLTSPTPSVVSSLCRRFGYRRRGVHIVREDELYKDLGVKSRTCFPIGRHTPFESLGSDESLG